MHALLSFSAQRQRLRSFLAVFPLVAALVSTSLPQPIQAPAAQNSGSKGPSALEPTTNGAAQRPYHTVFVLAVGISKYPHAQDRLDFAESDARKFAQVLSEKYKFTVSKLLLNDEATRTNILAEIEKIGAQLSKDNNDDFIFYYSGHGLTATEIFQVKGTDLSHRHGFILPYSDQVSLQTTNLQQLQTHALALKDLTDSVIGLNSARHRIIFLDSCFSGLAFKDQKVLTKPPEDAYDSVIRKPSIQLITAGLDTEFAYEDSRLKQSVFMDALLKQLQDSKVRTMEEIFLPLRVDIRDYFQQKGGGRMMTPQHRYLVYDEGTFVFVPPSQYANWSGSSPVLFASNGRRGKGANFDGAVTDDEVRKVKYKRYELTDDELAQYHERFEYRASIGDPLAAYAASEVYRLGIGVKRDSARSKLWMAEARDAGEANAQVQKDMTKAFAIMGAMNSGGINPQQIGGLIDAFSQNALQSFKGVSKGLLDVTRENNRSAGLDKCRELKKLSDEIVNQSSGKVNHAEVSEIKELIDLVAQELEFGAYDSALEDLAELPFLLRPIADKFPSNPDNEKKNPGFPFKPF